MDDAAKLNEALFDALPTPAMEKQAVDAVNEFTRIRLREDGFYRRIMPPLKISNDELDRAVETDKPIVAWAKPEWNQQALEAEWARSKDYPVAVIVDGDEVLFLPGECEPVSLRRPRAIEL